MISSRKKNRSKDAGQLNQLKHYADQLRMHSSRSLFAQGREYRYIASKLEDDVLQLFALVHMRLNDLLRASGRAESSKIVGEIQRYIDKASASVRDIIDSVKPPLLQELGLAPALRKLAAQTENEDGIRIDVVLDNEIPPLKPDASLCIYRAVRECFLNIVKHARADSAKLEIKAKPQQALLQVAVQDNGVGFSVSKEFSPDSDIRHLGLFAMREQIASLGGSMDIRSCPGQGTRVCLNIPVEGKQSK